MLAGKGVGEARVTVGATALDEYDSAEAFEAMQ
jgi:hypothetical protein